MSIAGTPIMLRREREGRFTLLLPRMTSAFASWEWKFPTAREVEQFIREMVHFNAGVRVDTFIGDEATETLQVFPDRVSVLSARPTAALIQPCYTYQTSGVEFLRGFISRYEETLQS